MGGGKHALLGMFLTPQSIADNGARGWKKQSWWKLKKQNRLHKSYPDENKIQRE
jgi:hypothetical protein